MELRESTPTFHIGKIKTDRYWIQCPDGRMLQIDTDTKTVLKKLSNRENVRAISMEAGIDEEDISTLLQMLDLDAQSDFFIVENDDARSEFASTVRVEKQLFINPWLGTRSFTMGLYSALALSLVAVILFARAHPFSFIIGLKEQWVIAGFLTLAVAIHEVGHLTAMPRHQNIFATIQWSGPIPMISIVCNEAWKLTKWERMRINLGGFIADALLCGIAATIGFVVHSLAPWIWTFLFIHMIRMVFALWPLLPGDGYWVLVDLFDQPNLWGKALDHLKERRVSSLSFYAIGRYAFLGLIWCLYGYILFLWGNVFLGKTLNEIMYFLIHPAPFLIMLNIFYIVYRLSTVALSRIAKRASN